MNVGRSIARKLKTCKREFSEEAVHDLRVATRRLLAVLDLLRALDPNPRIQKIRRALKNQLDEFDDLRDVQVMLVDASEAVSNFPELKPFEKTLQEREKRLLRKARKQIKQSKSSELEKRVEKIHLSVQERSSGGEVQQARARSGGQRLPAGNAGVWAGGCVAVCHDPPLANRLQEVPIHGRDRTSVFEEVSRAALRAYARVSKQNGIDSRH